MACKNHADRDGVATCASCGADVCGECAETGSDGKIYCAEDLPTQAPSVGQAAVPSPSMSSPSPAPAAAVAPPASAPAAAPPPPAAQPAGQAQGSGNLVLAALSYPIWIIALVVILTEKNDRNIRYHGWNGLFWGIAFRGCCLVVCIVAPILSNIPGVGVLANVLYLVHPAWLIFSIIFAVNAYNGKPVNIPVISDMARKQVGLL